MVETDARARLSISLLEHGGRRGTPLVSSHPALPSQRGTIPIRPGQGATRRPAHPGSRSTRSPSPAQPRLRSVLSNNSGASREIAVIPASARSVCDRIEGGAQHECRLPDESPNDFAAPDDAVCRGDDLDDTKDVVLVGDREDPERESRSILGSERGGAVPSGTPSFDAKTASAPGPRAARRSRSPGIGRRHRGPPPEPSRMHFPDRGADPMCTGFGRASQLGLRPPDRQPGTTAIRTCRIARCPFGAAGSGPSVGTGRTGGVGGRSDTSRREPSSSTFSFPESTVGPGRT